MKFLADANVLSEPTKSSPDPKVDQWLRANAAEIVVDPIVLGEMWEGIVALPDGRRKERLAEWFHHGPARLFCLDWTQETALVWAELGDGVRRRGFTVPVKDTMIAASAKLHGLIVATRNVDDFTRCGVPVFNPFA